MRVGGSRLEVSGRLIITNTLLRDEVKVKASCKLDDEFIVHFLIAGNTVEQISVRISEFLLLAEYEVYPLKSLFFKQLQK